MIFQHLIARRYAKALMLSLKDGDLDPALEILEDLANNVADEKSGLARLLADPAFSPLDRKKVLASLAKKSSWPEAITNFFYLLVEKNRAALVPEIYESFLTLVDIKRTRIRAKIKSSKELSKSELDELCSSLKSSLQKEIVPIVSVDPSLLAGVRVEASGMVFDASLSAKLDLMKHRLLSKL